MTVGLPSKLREDYLKCLAKGAQPQVSVCTSPGDSSNLQNLTRKGGFPESSWHSHNAEIARLLTSNSCALYCLPNFFIFFYSQWLKKEKIQENSAGPVQSKSFPGIKTAVKLL